MLSLVNSGPNYLAIFTGWRDCLFSRWSRLVFGPISSCCARVRSSSLALCIVSCLAASGRFGRLLWRLGYNRSGTVFNFFVAAASVFRNVFVGSDFFGRVVRLFRFFVFSFPGSGSLIVVSDGKFFHGVVDIVWSLQQQQQQHVTMFFVQQHVAMFLFTSNGKNTSLFLLSF